MAHFSVEFNRIHRRVLSNQLLSSCPWDFHPSFLQALTRADNRARYRSNPSRPVDLLPNSRTYKEHQAYLRKSRQVPVQQDQDPVQQGREELQRVLDQENTITMAPTLRHHKGRPPRDPNVRTSVSDGDTPGDAENTDPMVSISRLQFEEFNALQGDYNQLSKDYGDSKRDVVILKENNEILKENNGDLTKHNDELTKRIQERDALIAALNQKIEEYTEALRDAGKNPALVKNKELWDQVMVATEKYLSRNWKFIQDESDAVQAAKEVIAFLPSPLTIDEDEFVKVYKDAVNGSLQDLRHKIQSECKNRVKGAETFV